MRILKFKAKALQNGMDVKEAVQTLLEALKFKDELTCSHSVRVSEYALMMAKALNLSKQDTYQLELGALLHDVGKLGVPDEILFKTGKLTPEEFSVMKKHPVMSADLVAKIKALSHIIPIVKYHHERIDGLGYPEGLSGQQIPYLTKIVFIVDAFDAMTTDRPYRKALTTVQAYEELLRCSGTQFDAKLVNLFIREHKKKKYQFVKSNFYQPEVREKKAVGSS